MCCIEKVIDAKVCDLCMTYTGLVCWFVCSLSRSSFISSKQVINASRNELFWQCFTRLIKKYDGQ